MKPALRLATGLSLITLLSSWGFYAHYRVNRLAVFTLPKPMSGFYQSNIEFITEHAVAADKRRYVDSTEAPRHFLNADYYGKHPFAVLPENWFDAALKYSADTVIKNGTLPWTIQYNYYRLIRAFADHDTASILRVSANLGHYIADAYVPLHLTKNYNGQLTHQTGIHALWESRVPELFGDKYNYYAGKARYIKNPLTEAFSICKSSFQSVDTVLRFERLLSRTFPADKKYAVVRRGNRNVTDYSEAYALAYQKMLKGMIRRRMRSAILAVGSYWYSAWVDAGQPNLDNLIQKPLTTAEKKRMQQEELLYRTGKVLALDK